METIVPDRVSAVNNATSGTRDVDSEFEGGQEGKIREIVMDNIDSQPKVIYILWKTDHGIASGNLLFTNCFEILYAQHIILCTSAKLWNCFWIFQFVLWHQKNNYGKMSYLLIWNIQHDNYLKSSWDTSHKTWSSWIWDGWVKQCNLRFLFENSESLAWPLVVLYNCDWFSFIYFCWTCIFELITIHIYT